MKKLICIIAIFLLSNEMYAQNERVYKDKETSIQDHLMSLQIPSNVLDTISTEALLQKCLNFYYLIDFISYGGDSRAFEIMTEEYNGFSELMKRDNCGTVILQEYRKVSENKLETETLSPIEKGGLSLRALVLEYLLANKNVLSSFDEKGTNALLSVVANTIAMYDNNKELFSGIHKIPISLIFSRVVNNTTEKKNMTRLMSYYVDFDSIPLVTPQGTQIESAFSFVGIDFNDNEKANVTQEFIDAFSISPDSIIDEPTYTYNCHAYAWHMSTGGDPIWLNGIDMNHPNGYYLSPYWTDGCFSIVSDNSDYTTVLYSGDHSAIYLGNGVYESKWGAGPVVRHSLTKVPSSYLPHQPLSYFKRQLPCPSFIGANTLYNQSTYYIVNLPNIFSVTWSLSGDNVSNFILQTNTPSTNQCTITRKDNVEFSGSTSLVLSAQIKYNGIVIYTAEKVITAPYISGPTVPCGYSTYTVEGRPSNSTIVWSHVGHGIITDTTFQQTHPTSCILVNTDNRCLYGMLTAKVVVNNDTVGVLNRRIDTGYGFTGTWYQPATLTDTLNSTPQSFHNLSLLEYVPGRTVYLMSDDFIDATVTHSGSGIINWSNSNGVISFNTLGLIGDPIRSVPAGIVIEGTYPNSCKHFKLNLFETTGSLPLYLTYNNPNSGTYEFFMSENTDGGQSEQRNTGNDEPWKLTIIRSDTGAKVYESSSSLGSKSVTTTGWLNGVYIAIANIMNQNYSVKFSVGR